MYAESANTSQCGDLGSKTQVLPVIISDTPVSTADLAHCRTQVGRLLCNAALRPDMQYGVTQLSKHVHCPTDETMLKRMIRSLEGNTEVLRLRAT